MTRQVRRSGISLAYIEVRFVIALRSNDSAMPFRLLETMGCSRPGTALCFWGGL